MSFQSQTATTFVKLQLTNLGRQKMALGKFKMEQVVFSDREMQYDFNRRYPVNNPKFAKLNPASNQLHDVETNKILAPAWSAAKIPSTNYDGSAAYQIGATIAASTQLLTARTESRGLFTQLTEGTNQSIGEYTIDKNKFIRSATTNADEFVGTHKFDNLSFPQPVFVGDLVKINFQPPTTSVVGLDGMSPMYSQWYRVRAYGILSGEITVDRRLPNFGAGGSQVSYFYQYPFSATTDYWNSGTTSPGEVWSLSIVRTSHVIGTTTAMAQSISGYTNYASKEFSGIKRYFGFDKEQRAVGFVYHQDKFTGNTYGDLLIPRTTRLDLPELMWHRKNGILPGKAIKGGHRFVDAGSEIFYDEIAKTNFTILYDGTDQNKIAVGRVYYELKLIVILDQELLTAMSYKTNRNFTLPKLKVELSDVNTGIGNTPWMRDGYTYYFTYQVRDSGVFTTNESHGFRTFSPCEYWTKIAGKNKPDGTYYFPKVTLESGQLPYLRTGPDIETYSGTGWSARVFQLLVNEIPNNITDGSIGEDLLRPNRWSAVTRSVTLVNSNGVYAGETGENYINPYFLQSRTFTIDGTNIGSLAGFDFEDNTPHFVVSSAQTTHVDYINDNGLNYGNETFLNGNVTTTFGLRTEKLVATVSVNKDELNNSTYGGHNAVFDQNTYITEIGILDDQNELLAVGKPTYPIRKNDARHLLFQLEINI